jgi:hypothetical protein
MDSSGRLDGELVQYNSIIGGIGKDRGNMPLKWIHTDKKIPRSDCQTFMMVSGKGLIFHPAQNQQTSNP